MPVRCLTILAVAFAALSPTPSFAQSEKTPTVVVRVRSLETVLDNARTVVGLVGQEELGRQFEGIVRAKIGEQGLEGIDLKRPIGAYLFFGKELEDVGAVVMVPIASEKAFLSLLENISFKPTEKDGIYTVKTGFPVDVSFRFANKYAYFTAINTESIATNRLQDPAKVLASKSDSDISAAIRIDQLPEAAKLLMLASVEDELNKIRDKKEAGETPAQQAFRLEALKQISKLFATVLEDGEQINYEASLRRQQGEAHASYSLTAKSGSKLAKMIADLGSTKSLFAGFNSSDAVLSGLVHVMLPPEIRKSFEAVVEETKEMALAGLNDPAKKKQAESLLEALLPSLKAGELDAGFALTGPNANKKYTVVAGVKIKEGDKLAKIVRDLLDQTTKDLPPQVRDLIKLDADSVGNVKIHRFDVGPAFDPKAAEVFGQSPVHVAIRNDAAFVSVGEEGLAAIKKAVASQAAGAAPPLAFEVAVARLAPLMGKALNSSDAGSNAFANDDGRITVRLEGGAALTAQVTAKLSVLQFFGGIAGKKLKIN